MANEMHEMSVVSAKEKSTNACMKRAQPEIKSIFNQILLSHLRLSVWCNICGYDAFLMLSRE